MRFFCVHTTEAVAYHDNIDYRTLPRVHQEEGEGSVTGAAAQAFLFQPPRGSPLSGYLAGHLDLPPQGIKDHEPVGACTHVFTIVSGQPGSLEVAYAAAGEEFQPTTATRFLLGSSSDMFRVPPGNRYRIENHSCTTPCRLTWTIIRPHLGGTASSRNVGEE